VVRNQEHVHMDGAAIFSFTMEDVPPQIDEILAFSGDTRESIEHFLFHQPNPFILKQMAEKMKFRGETAEQCRQPLRQLQFGDHSAEHRPELQRTVVAG